MSWSGWRLTKIRFPGRRGPQSTRRARMRTAWQFQISLCWNWPLLRVRAGSALTSASNPSCRKSSPGLLFCQSVAGHVPVPWDFQRVIPRTPRIALSGLLRWSRGYSCLPPTVRSVARERFRRFGENNDTGLERFHDYCARSILSQVGLFSVKSPVLGIFTGDTYRETFYWPGFAGLLEAGAAAGGVSGGG